MLKKVRCTLLFVISFVFTGSVLASQSGMYGGLAYHTGNYSTPGGTDFSPPALSFKFGKYLHDNIAVEGRLMTGIFRWKVVTATSEKILTVKNGYSVLVRGNWPMNKDASLYALAGYGQLGLEMENTVGTTTTTDTNSESGAMYGVGAEATFGNSGYGIYAEYMSYPGGTGSADYDYTGFNLGITKAF